LSHARHCRNATEEAIRVSRTALDCFAAPAMTKPSAQKRTRRLQKIARPAGRFTFALSTNATCQRDYAYGTLEPPF
jgi:hypothetical protein